MRKADKRARGVERNKVYAEEVRAQGLAAQHLDNQMRAERQAEIRRRAEIKANREKAPKSIVEMHETAWKLAD